MSNQIVPVTQETWMTIQAIAPVAQASRLFGVTQEQAAIVMLTGHELGLSLSASFRYIHLIDGKPSLSPQGALALIHQSGQLAGLRITDGDGFCEVWMKRKNGFEYTTRYTMEQARKAGLVKPNSGWEKYEPNMLRWRAIGYCADVVFPDVTGGLESPEELGANVNQQGEPMPNPPQVHVYTVDNAPAEPPLTLASLMASGYTPEQIMTANDGKIPGTTAECQAVLAKLQEAGNA